MTSHGSELYGLALALVSDDTPHDALVGQLVEAAEHDRLRLLQACAWADSARRSFPFDHAAQTARQALSEAMVAAEHRPSPPPESSLSPDSPLSDAWHGIDTPEFRDDLYLDLERLRAVSDGEPDKRRRFPARR